MDTHRHWEALSKLSRVGQIGMVVQDIQAAATFYTTFFNVPHWYRSRMVSYEVIYRGQPIDLEWDIVVGYSGQLQIELIHVQSGQQNLYREILGDQQGFHHFGLIVNHIDKHLAEMRQLDIDVLQQGTIHFVGGAVTRFAYLDTIPHCGFIIELVETRLRGINFGMPEWLMRAGLLIGSTERLS